LKEEEQDKQEDLQHEDKKHRKNGNVKSTSQAPLVTFYENISLRIKTELMSVRGCERLRRITARDTRIIREYLRIIYHNEDRKVFYKGKLKPLINSYGKINQTLLEYLTLTTSKNSGNKIRLSVPHDLKKRYPHCSHDEFQECRNKAMWMYESWKALQRTSTKEQNRPQLRKKTPRILVRGKNGRGTVQVHYDPDNTTAKLWLKLRDSLDTKRDGKKNHSHLHLPLAYSPYHEKRLELDNIKTVELVYKTKKRQWWAHLTQCFTVPQYKSTNPPAVLGVDLGIKKTAVAVVLNHKGKVTMDEICFIVHKERQVKIFRLEKRIGSIQSELDKRIMDGHPHNQLNVKLTQLRSKLRVVTEQELGYAVNQLVEFIEQLKKRYNLFVSIGYPKHIRNSHQRGSGNKSLRRQLHKWCYHLFITKLKHKIQQQGFESNRVIAVDEKYTSKRCSRCFSLNTTRSSQGRFVCHKCKYELNADLNGARNIAKRLISYALEPIGKFKEKNILCDRLTGDFHKLEHYACFKSLGQWLKYSFGDTSFL